VLITCYNIKASTAGNLLCYWLADIHVIRGPTWSKVESKIYLESPRYIFIATLRVISYVGASSHGPSLRRKYLLDPKETKTTKPIITLWPLP
jgi:hypothetical protein